MTLSYAVRFAPDAPDATGSIPSQSGRPESEMASQGCDRADARPFYVLRFTFYVPVEVYLHTPWRQKAIATAKKAAATAGAAQADQAGSPPGSSRPSSSRPAG